MITEVKNDVICQSYQDILERIEKLNTHLVILDKPVIGLPTQARWLILALKDALSDAPLRSMDRGAVESYLSTARSFCDSYFEPTDFETLPAIAPLRLPCDSHELTKMHEELYIHYLELRSTLRKSQRKNKEKLYAGNPHGI